MSRVGYCFQLPKLGIFSLMVAALAACGADNPEPSSSAAVADGNSLEADIHNLQAELQAACAMFPNLPGCGSSPESQPGFAKFTVGRADAVQWAGRAGCKEISVRTGRQSANQLVKAEGEVVSSCDPTEIHFEFVFRRHSQALSPDAWTSAFRPLNRGAANRLLESCTSDTRPDPSVIMESWWRANNTYAENLLLDYMSPLVYATRLIPFDDDGYERAGEEMIDGRNTVLFSNNAATVWMDLAERNRPLRVVNTSGSTDIRFSAWDQGFSAVIPQNLRDLSEICSVH